MTLFEQLLAAAEISSSTSQFSGLFCRNRALQ
jgi:hypothetical protein